ncbi:MAG: hypothetical protein AAF226_04895, partial [Verrucomicrobiota bacterium]
MQPHPKPLLERVLLRQPLLLGLGISCFWVYSVDTERWWIAHLINLIIWLVAWKSGTATRVMLS